jgi:hypothetical protein
MSENVSVPSSSHLVDDQVIDMVNHPKHYQMQGIEAIDILEMSMTKEAFEGYLKGNILKYIIRYKHKNKPKEDLEKSRWYLNKLIEKI